MMSRFHSIIKLKSRNSSAAALNKGVLDKSIPGKVSYVEEVSVTPFVITILNY